MLSRHDPDYLLDIAVSAIAAGPDCLATIDDIPAWNRQMQRSIHMFGRYGITIFAIGDTIDLKPSVSLEFGVNGKVDVLNSWHVIIYVPSRV